MPEREQVILPWAHYQSLWSRSKPSRQVPRVTNSSQNSAPSQAIGPSHTHTHTHTHTHHPRMPGIFLVLPQEVKMQDISNDAKARKCPKSMGSFCFADTSWLYLSYLCSMLGLQGELMEWHRGKSTGLTARRFWSSEHLLCELGLLIYPF